MPVQARTPPVAGLERRYDPLLSRASNPLKKLGDIWNAVKDAVKDKFANIINPPAFPPGYPQSPSHTTLPTQHTPEPTPQQPAPPQPTPNNPQNPSTAPNQTTSPNTERPPSSPHTTPQQEPTQTQGTGTGQYPGGSTYDPSQSTTGEGTSGRTESTGTTSPVHVVQGVSLTSGSATLSSETALLGSSSSSTASNFDPLLKHSLGGPNATGSPSNIPGVLGATKKSNVGAIAGGIVGAIMVLLLILLGVFLYMRRRKKQHLAPSAEFLGQNASFQRVPSFVETSYRHHPPSSFSPITEPSHRGPVAAAVGSNLANPFADTSYQDHGPVYNPPYVNMTYSDPSPPPSSSGHSPFDDPEDPPQRPPPPPSSSDHSPVIFAPRFTVPYQETPNRYIGP